MLHSMQHIQSLSIFWQNYGNNDMIRQLGQLPLLTSLVIHKALDHSFCHTSSNMHLPRCMEQDTTSGISRDLPHLKELTLEGDESCC